MWILAFTHVFVAGPLFPATPFVARVSETPPTDTAVCALTLVVPVIDEVSVIWHEAVPPTVVHGFGVVNEPGPESIEKLIDVPSAALTKPAPEPSFTVTWAVNVCDAPTRFVPFGEIEMRASTNVFTASAELLPAPSV